MTTAKVYPLRAIVATPNATKVTGGALMGFKAPTPSLAHTLACIDGQTSECKPRSSTFCALSAVDREEDNPVFFHSANRGVQ